MASRTRSEMAAGSSSIANATVRSNPCGPVIRMRKPPLNGSAAIHASCGPNACLPPTIKAASIRSRRLTSIKAPQSAHCLAVLEPYLSRTAPSPLQGLPAISCQYFGRRRRFDLRAGSPSVLAGLETRIPFCGDGGFPGARVAALPLLPLFHCETAEST